MSAVTGHALTKTLQRLPNAAERAQKREALERWEADRIRLMLHQPFVALLALRLDLVPVVDSRLATACTDGERIFVDAGFLLGLKPEHRLFVLAHEVWHAAARHALRRSRREPTRWNIAADHEVNALLTDEGLSLPSDGVYFPELHGSNAETVYTCAPCAAMANADSRRGKLADRHDVSLAPGGGVRDPDFDVFNRTPDWSAWPARVVAAAQQLERSRGTLPGGLSQLVEAYRRPRLPWRTILARFVTRTVGDERVWLPPSRRGIARGLYLPSRRGVRLAATVVIDTSASTRADLAGFVGELVGIAAGFGRYRLRLIYCDAAVQGEQLITDETAFDPAALSFKGGGGTSLRPVFAHLEREAPPSALLYFTDGYGPAPRTPPAYPVLWVLTADGCAPARWGERLWLPPHNQRREP